MLIFVYECINNWLTVQDNILTSILTFDQLS